MDMIADGERCPEKIAGSSSCRRSVGAMPRFGSDIGGE